LLLAVGFATAELTGLSRIFYAPTYRVGLSSDDPQTVVRIWPTATAETDLPTNLAGGLTILGKPACVLEDVSTTEVSLPAGKYWLSAELDGREVHRVFMEVGHGTFRRIAMPPSELGVPFTGGSGGGYSGDTEFYETFRARPLRTVAIPAAANLLAMEKAKLQGTWSVTAAETDGKPMLRERIEEQKPRLVFAGDRLTHLKEGEAPKETDYTINPLQKPATIDIPDFFPGGTQGLALYRWKSDTLQICASPRERPREFTTAPGSEQILFTLRRDSDGPAKPPGTSPRSRRFAPPKDTPLTQDGVTPTADGWKIDNHDFGERTVRLFEVRDLDVKDCRLVFRVRMKTETTEKLQNRQIFTRPVTAFRPEVVIKKGPTGNTVTQEAWGDLARRGNTSWAQEEITTTCRSQPEVIALNLKVEGIGTVWIKDVELLATPLAPQFGGQAAADTGPFVVLARDGKAEQKFATLAGAVKAAQSGDTVEIRGDGPFDVPGIQVQGKRLVIRAAGGFRPVLRRAPATPDGAGFLLDSDSALVLEGLDLQDTVGEPRGKGQRGLVRVRDCPLYLAHCRCTVRGERLNVFARGAAACEVRNSLLLGDRWHALGWALPVDGVGRLSVQNCILAGNEGAFSAHWHPNVWAAKDLDIELKGNTILARWPLELRLENEAASAPRDAKKPTARLTTSENVIDGKDSALLFNQALPKPLPGPEAEAWLRGNLLLRERKNYYSLGGALLKIADRFEPLPQARSVLAVADYEKFWSTSDTGSGRQALRYAGGNLQEKLTLDPLSLRPADFRLADGSPGKGAGSDGKDLGADSDLVGPGAAYERWKMTPEYQEWQKKTTAVVKTIVPEPFVLLARDASAERRFATPSAAAEAAQAGDTVEIRGDGPFETGPVLLDKALTLRAGKGHRPVLVYKGWGSLLRTTAPLVLEGLEINGEGHREEGEVLIQATGAPLRIAHCRIMSREKNAVWAAASPLLEVRHSEVVARNWGAINWEPTNGGKLVVQNCLIVAWGAVWLHHRKPAEDAEVELTGNTFVSNCFCGYRFYQDPVDADQKMAAHSVRITVTRNIADSSQYFCFGEYVDRDRPHQLDALAGWYRDHVTWEGRDNLLPVDQFDSSRLDRKVCFLTFRRFDAQGKGEVRCWITLKDWQTFWKSPKALGTQGTPQVAGGDLIDRVLWKDMKSVTPADFRLESVSPGKGLGGDVDRVGPGAAYEKWMQTPEYQEWRKKNDALLAEKK
jgi:uncharacterized protein (TIGR03067 family)